MFADTPLGTVTVFLVPAKEENQELILFSMLQLIAMGACKNHMAFSKLSTELHPLAYLARNSGDKKSIYVCVCIFMYGRLVLSEFMYPRLASN